MKRNILIVAALSVALLLSWSRAWAYTPQQLLAIHQNYLNQTASQMESASRTGNASDYYFTSIYLMGMLSGVEAGLVVNPAAADSELQRAMHYIDNMIGAAVQNKGHWVWDSNPNELYNYQGNEPIARAAMLIMTTPAFRSKYSSKATSYAHFVDDSVIQRWYYGQYNGSPSWLVGDPPDWGDGNKFNDKSWLLGDICNSLYLATGNQFYLGLANKISAGFKSFLQPFGNGWVWNNGTIPIGSDTNGEAGSVGNQAGAPDTAHANRVPVMMAFQYESQSGGWTLSDLQRLAGTLSDVCWNGSISNPLVANYVNGSNKPYRTRFTVGGNGFIFSGWALMGRFSARAEQLGEAILQAMVSGHSNATVDANDSDYYKTVALSGHLARNVAVNQVRGAPGQGKNGLAANGAPVVTGVTGGVIPVTGMLQASVSGATQVQWNLTRTGGAPNATPQQAAKAASLPKNVSLATNSNALALTSVPVGLGQYHVNVTAVGADGTVSAPASADVQLVDASLGATRVFPNPWRADQHMAAPVTFDHITPGSKIELFTIAGQMVRDLVAPSNSVTWDLQNDSGDRVGSGIYLYVVTNDFGQKFRGELAVIR